MKGNEKKLLIVKPKKVHIYYYQTSKTNDASYAVTLMTFGTQNRI